MKLLPDDQLRRFESHLTAICRTCVADIDSPLLCERLVTYVRLGGKRIRPQLVLWTHAHATAPDAPAPDAVLDVAAAWELFHAFLLVHDDIIDGSDQRRDQPSLHRQLQSLDSDSPRFGCNLGIVAGDLFYAWANRLLSDLDVPATVYRDMHRLFARVATTTGLGQAVDVMQSHAPLERRDEATLLREYHWKTAAYTFEGPMLSAAILAGLPPETHAVISRYALSLGQAYQMQNDLLDLVRPVTEGSDLVEGKHTFTLLKAREFLAGTEREAFDTDLSRIVASNGRSLGLAESVRRRLLETPAVNCTVERINNLLDGCLADADTLPPALHGAMAGCLKQLRAGYFVTPTPSA
ncbi:MAG TPA: polyprenyl synthetase family protein [Tepidisphaeraceae bacterium]|jgi:geranylgeranyl diphosphate synthase type I